MRFESILGLSIAVHLVLIIVISSTMEMLDYEDVPIKARVNIRFDYPQKKSKSIQKPVLKLESGSKALSLQPIQPLPEVQKPVLKTTKNSLKPEITKPSISKKELPKLKQEFRQALNHLNPFNLRAVCKILFKRNSYVERYLSYKPDPFKFGPILIIHSDDCKESHLNEWKLLLPCNTEIAHIRGSNHSNIMYEYKYEVSQIIDTWLHSLKVK